MKTHFVVFKFRVNIILEYDSDKITSFVQVLSLLRFSDTFKGDGSFCAYFSELY